MILVALPACAAPADAVVTRAAWEAWQDGLAERFTLPDQLPPLRMLLVWDNLTGHKTAEMVVWLCRHGIMPLYTPLGGSWLNMAESVQRILKRRTLDGQHPQSPKEIGTWFRSVPGSSRPHRLGITSPPHFSGTASAGNGGEGNPAMDTPSAARPLALSNQYHRAGAAITNGTPQGK